MKNVFKIFISDIKNTSKNWIAVFIVLGIIVIPSFYAWINIYASIDPYSNTSGIKIAVVNEDKGADMLGNKINIGKDVIHSLQKNKSLGWTFYEDAEKAIKDTKIGKVYAAIIIPEDFSDKLSTLLENPQKASIEYYVNLKKNAIAPKMTNAGATALQKQIEQSFTNEVVVKLYEILNEAGIKLSDNYNNIENLKKFIYDKEEDLYGIGDKGKEAAERIENGLNTINSQNQQIERINKLLSDSNVAVKELQNDMGRLNTKITKLEPQLINILDSAENISYDVKEGSKKLLGVKEKIENILEKTDRLLGLIKKLQEGLGLNSSKVSQKQATIQEIKSSLGLLNEIHDLSRDINSLVKDVSKDLQAEELPKVYDYLELGDYLSGEAGWALDYALEKSNNVLDMIAKVTDIGNQILAALQEKLDRWPRAEEDLRQLYDKIREIDEKIQLDSLISFLNNSGNQEGDFFSEPILIKTHEFFPMKNYGAAMTPFYTTLCLWVGALILCALLTTEARNLKTQFTMKQEFFGKWLLFITFGMLQGLIVALGDIYLLKIEIAHETLFVGLSMFYSLVFVTIVYTLVAQMGNIGKALGVLLLVIQIAGSGGTFPIEVTPRYFQNLHGLMPFTYAIDGMREAVAGITYQNLRTDVIILLTYLGAFIFLGLISKHWIRKVTYQINHKLSEARITEH